MTIYVAIETVGENNKNWRPICDITDVRSGGSHECRKRKIQKGGRAVNR